MRRSSASSVSSLHQYPNREAERSPSPAVSQSSDRVPSEEPPPAYTPPPMDELAAGRQSREGSVEIERQSVSEFSGSSPPPAYTFPPTDEWGMDETDAFKTEC